MLATQIAADGTGDPVQEASHAVKAEAVQVDEDAPVAGVEMAVQLVEHGGLSRPPLPVQHDGRVTVPSDQVPPDKGEDVIPAEEHLGAGDRASRDVGVHMKMPVHVASLSSPGPERS